MTDNNLKQIKFYFDKVEKKKMEELRRRRPELADLDTTQFAHIIFKEALWDHLKKEQPLKNSDNPDSATGAYLNPVIASEDKNPYQFYDELHINAEEAKRHDFRYMNRNKSEGEAYP